MNPGAPVLLALFAALYLTRAAASEGTVAFLGPKGSYSDEAATKYASRADITGTTPLTNITEIAQFVRDGRVQFGLLPFENSIGGFVVDSAPSGALGSYRFALVLDSTCGANLIQIQTALRPIGTSLCRTLSDRAMRPCRGVRLQPRKLRD
jgi:Prephenate dehydratase